MKKNGFTLIELLAVILILGIIALIAIPMVNKIINENKRNSFELSANNIVTSIENTCQLQTLKGENITTTYEFNSGVVSPSLDVKGSLPITGSATVNSICNVNINVTNGKFTATKKLSANSVTVIDGAELIYSTYSNGTAIYFNPVTGIVCPPEEAVSTTGTKTGCMKWYTFNDSGSSSSKINLILDHNTTALVAWNSSQSAINGPTNIMTQLQTDTSSWVGVPTRTDSYIVDNGIALYTINYSAYKARLITMSEIALVTGNTMFNENTTSYTSWFYFDSNNQTHTAKTPGSSNYDWLFDYTSGCTGYGCNIADSSNYGYWTSTAVAGYSRLAWCIGSHGNTNNYNVHFTTSVGLRPVITISKLSL